MRPILLRAGYDGHHIQMRHQHHRRLVRVLADPGEEKAFAEFLRACRFVEIRKGLLHPAMHGFERHGLLVFLDAVAIRDGLEAHGLGEVLGNNIRVYGNGRRSGLFGRRGDHQRARDHDCENHKKQRCDPFEYAFHVVPARVLEFVA